jgi:hypothetical protein
LLLLLIITHTHTHFMASSSPAVKALEDVARPKLVLALHGGILDSRRNAPDTQLDCVSTLLKILKVC